VEPVFLSEARLASIYAISTVSAHFDNYLSFIQFTLLQIYSLTRFAHISEVPTPFSVADPGCFIPNPGSGGGGGAIV
jgi:hypothetical protein